MGIPYAAATTGKAAREEISKILRRFGCQSIGFMDDFTQHELLLAFTHRGRQVQLHASAKGWAQMQLKENPWSHHRRSTRQEYEQRAPAGKAMSPSIRSCAIGSKARLRRWSAVFSRSRRCSCPTC